MDSSVMRQGNKEAHCAESSRGCFTVGAEAVSIKIRCRSKNLPSTNCVCGFAVGRSHPSLLPLASCPSPSCQHRSVFFDSSHIGNQETKKTSAASCQCSGRRDRDLLGFNFWICLNPARLVSRCGKGIVLVGRAYSEFLLDAELL
jgi:hypothetical protein